MVRAQKPGESAGICFICSAHHIVLAAVMEHAASACDIHDNNLPQAGDWGNPYVDVSDADWFHDVVRVVTEEELMQSTSAARFLPNTPVTQGMFVAVMGRLAKNFGEETEGYINAFQDMPAGQWYTPFVSWADGKGMVLGRSKTRFTPEEIIAREQMAMLMIRSCEYLDVQLRDDGVTFSDAAACACACGPLYAVRRCFSQTIGILKEAPQNPRAPPTF